MRGAWLFASRDQSSLIIHRIEYMLAGIPPNAGTSHAS